MAQQCQACIDGFSSVSVNLSMRTRWALLIRQVASLASAGLSVQSGRVLQSVLAKCRNMRRNISPPSPESQVGKVTPTVPEQSTPAPVLPWHPGSRLVATSICRRGGSGSVSQRASCASRDRCQFSEKSLTRGTASAEGEL